MIDNRIQRVFELWVDITGVDPTSNTIRFKDYDVYSANKEMEEALNFNDEGITALLLMDYFAEEYLCNKSFSAMSLITDFEDISIDEIRIHKIILKNAKNYSTCCTQQT